ncbi:MAG: nucleotidyltransferase family protein [Burkholderiales bacterium]|nr:nucleotidyltransferase family protein [Burkholderiales bacterium]
MSPSWAEVARAVHRELGHGQTRDAGAAIEPLRLGVFWLAAAPGNAGVEGVAALYGEWSDTDWESALRVAEAEGLLSWCVHRLRETPLSCPPALLDALAPQLLRHRHRNRLIALAAIECLRRLDDAGIDARWIKGAPLGKRLYGDALLRDVRDIDLLVSPAQASAAVQALHAAGYAADVALRCFGDPHYLASHRQVTLRALRGWFEVDLHWHLMEPWLVPNAHRHTTTTSDECSGTEILGHTVTVDSDVQLTRLIDANVLSSHSAEMKSSVDFVRHHAAGHAESGVHMTHAGGGASLAQQMSMQTTAWLRRIADASRVSPLEVARDLFTTREPLPIERWQAWRQHAKRAKGWREYLGLARTAWYRALAHGGAAR